MSLFDPISKEDEIRMCILAYFRKHGSATYTSKFICNCREVNIQFLTKWFANGNYQEGKTYMVFTKVRDMRFIVHLYPVEKVDPYLQLPGFTGEYVKTAGRYLQFLTLNDILEPEYEPIEHLRVY